jgi:hypothetical protein
MKSPDAPIAKKGFIVSDQCIGINSDGLNSFDGWGSTDADPPVRLRDIYAILEQ